MLNLMLLVQIYGKNPNPPNKIKKPPKRAALVIRPGFEPGTHSLEGCCSIQLSYQTVVFSECKDTKCF